MKALHQFDLNLLKAFDVLMDERNVSRAAERLNLTQSAMSGMLARLREGLGDPLFVRAQRGIVPTERALSLAEPIKTTLAHIDGILQPAEFEPATAKMTLRVAATDYSMSAVMVHFVAKLALLAPNIKVALLPLTPDLPQQLSQGKLDFALLVPSEGADYLHLKPLYDEHYLCAMRADHRLAANAELTLADYCQAQHILASPVGGGFSGVSDMALAKQGLKRNVKVSLNNFLLLPQLLQHSDMIATVPSRLTALLPNIKHFPTPMPVQGFTKYIAWHDRTHNDPAHRWLRSLVGEVCRGFMVVPI
ncbi:LysR family transcriptional regulator [Testudinibacter sp. TR-2022]|uniref:LysR family transcriptional regulator n=1 Tax=Testudinibacter sp. TR-2022 TaxID=2585029 RepID=UPI00111A022C|nr:LysR family transcriptional regulator [Testudinibacter sp. TR-2022]TNH06796.1 LysR family transcriptional regulator [Pasteurellaceae bacterium Phil11]TNH24126.1 LysR family transcriptional regulator [Testudinibacter sp. TR-2022]TNH27595.1 LysR family transcriptional regulator [Testudinibacter sp. TR-2022]